MRKLGPVGVDRKKQKGYGRIPHDNFFEGWRIEEVPQRCVQPHLDMALTVHKIRRAVMAMGNGKTGGDAELPGEYWKALMSD